MAKRKTKKIKLIVTYQIWYKNGYELEERISDCKDWARKEPSRPWEIVPTNATLMKEPKKAKVAKAPDGGYSEVQAHLTAQKKAGVPFSEAKLLPNGRNL